MVREVGLGQCGTVLDEDPVPPSQKRGYSPQFSAHSYCGQAAAWVNMALGVEVGLGPGHIRPMLDGDPAPLPRKGAQPPNLRLMSIVAKQLDGSRYHLVRR